MKNTYLTIAGVVLLGVVAGFFGIHTKEPVQVMCTMEAKICPDGSGVGRSGPQCEFAPCPIVKESTQAKIGEKILIAGGVYLTPTEVTEDSRCPSDVVCIWAGQVKLDAAVYGLRGLPPVGQKITLILGKSLTIEGKEITLVDVVPATHSKEKISPGDYIFTFQVK